MSKMFRMSEQDLHNRISRAMRGTPPVETHELKPAPGVPIQADRGAAQGIESGANEAASKQGGGVVMLSDLIMLPYPVGANRVWRNVRGRVIANPKAKVWKHVAASLMAGRYMFDGDVSVEYILHPRKNKNGSSSKSRLDVDAPAKALLDALSGVCYRDDKQVTRLTGCIGEPVINGGLSVEVRSVCQC